MAVEQIRGCGYRKVGGLYLCGRGLTMVCDRLPYELDVCPVCGNGVKFSRGFQWLDWSKYAGGHFSQCSCLGPPSSVICPVCWPASDAQPYGLLWVGEQFYTLQSFIKEALTMGVSRRIAAIPRNLKLGETWVLFAHKKAVTRLPTPEELDSRRYEAPGAEEGRVFRVGVLAVELPGVFYIFRPRRLELLLWQSEFTYEKAAELERKHITPIIIPDGDVDHDPRTSLIPKSEETSKLFFEAIRNTLRGDR